jgi:hypothetical protein
MRVGWLWLLIIIVIEIPVEMIFKIGSEIFGGGDLIESLLTNHEILTQIVDTFDGLELLIE